MNTKNLLLDFVIECQFIEEYLKKLIITFSVDSKNVNNDINKKLEKCTMGCLIKKTKSFIRDRGITDKLNELKDTRNEIVHDIFIKGIEETNYLKMSEAEKDKILNNKLIQRLSRGIELSNECYEDLISLNKKNTY
jgi:hypothetical protein